MAKTPEYYHNLAETMIEKDRARDKAFLAYTNMKHADWWLPADLQKLEWAHKSVSTIPHDAVSTGTRVMSGGSLRYKMIPLLADASNKKRANEIERNLEWNVKSANRRRPASVQSDVMESAITYAAVALQVIDLDYQAKLVEKLGMDPRRWKAARRYSRFIMPTYNPMDVHARYSNYMPECVLLCQKRTMRSIVDEWGEMAGVVEDGGMESETTYYDLMDYDYRCVWYGEGKGAKSILHQEHEMPFLNWVALTGGSTLENQPEHAHHSLLYSIYRSGQWVSENIMNTIRQSEVLAHSAEPRKALEGASEGVDVQLDAFDPAKIAHVPMGATLKDLAPNIADPALGEIVNALGMAQYQSTVSRVLMGGETSAGTAFSALNLQVLTAVGALKPYRDLAEKALAEVGALMLLWTEFSKIPLRAFGDGKTDAGAAYTIEPDEIEPSAIYLECNLTPELPIDKQQRINAAVMAKQTGLYDTESLLEQLGEEDPQRIMDSIAQEQLDQVALGMMIQQIQGQAQMAQQAQQQEAQMMAQQSAAVQGGGEGFNPEAGGLPPAQFEPGATREQLTGMDRQGNPLAQEAF